VGEDAKGNSVEAGKHMTQYPEHSPTSPNAQYI